jgi:hypothetical protein
MDEQKRAEIETRFLLDSVMDRRDHAPILNV